MKKQIALFLSVALLLALCGCTMADVKAGKVVDGKAAIQNIRSRYGI